MPLPSLFRSDFLKNISLLSSSTALGQVIAILTTPVLTRIYSPVEYDVFGIFFMVSSLATTITTLQYHNVIIVSKDDDDARSALSLCLVFTLGVSLLTLLGAFGAYLLFPPSHALSDSLPWLLLAPISVFFGGWNVAFGAWANRRQKFMLLARNRMVAAIFVPMFSITIGLIWKGVTGLIVGLLVGQAIPALMLSTHFFRAEGRIVDFHRKGMSSVFGSNLDFLKFSLPAEFINNFINQLPIIMFASMNPAAGVIGNYNLCNRLLGMPVQLISSSVGEVFRQKASSEYARLGECRSTFVSTFKFLLATGVIPFTLLMFFGPFLFRTILGPKWGTAGTFSSILAPLFLLKFIVSPLSYLYFIAGRQREDFIVHLITIALIFVSFRAAYMVSDNILVSLGAFAAANCLIYLFYLYRTFLFSGQAGRVKF